ncbi:serine hydroxymethyltransferase [Mycoplasmopsis lipophila]|uniref:serine hydroxymethyltransferase n=1 Tax=Mycoplasmopsis lipophila TaxID=2117 RepID=UPI003872A78C
MYKKINLKDHLIANAINKELIRQKTNIELIASENYVSNDVLKATGSILTNKYGEGYPEKRYYGGCDNVDVIEKEAINRLKKLFGVEYANVQPYSGSVANAAAIASICNYGDKIMGLSLDSGGHLSHGYKISFSGNFYNAITYDVDENGFLDYNKIKEIAIAEKPKLIICGYSAYSRIVDFEKFREIADACGAKLMADIAHIAGLIIAGVHPSPVNYADIITSTTHKTLRGTRGGIIMTNDPEIAKKVDRWVFPGYQGGPLFHTIAGKAVAFYEALQPSFKIYGKQIVENAHEFCDEFLKLGAKIISGGTDNHLFIIDVLKTYNIDGLTAQKVLEMINITANKNSIPFDTLPPSKTSGLRLGTPAMTSRDFKEWKLLANVIHNVLKEGKEIISNLDYAKKIIRKYKPLIKDLNKKYPIKRSY